MIASSAADSQLAVYLALLDSWNARINLVGRRQIPMLVSRHLSDSLAILPLLPSGATRIIDLGSGAGLPGVPIAIVTGAETHLVDRDQRKCAFLREVRRTLGVPIQVHEADFRTLPPVGADVVVSRATATLTVLLDAAARHARKGGTMLFHKSRLQTPEIDASRSVWVFAVQHFANPADQRGRLWRITNLARRHG